MVGRQRTMALAVAAGWLMWAQGMPPALGGTASGQFAVEETGRMTCAQFVAAKAKGGPAMAQARGFIDGYLTAANRYEPQTFDLTPWHNAAALALILEAHCKAQPAEALAMAAQRLVAGLQPVRLAEPSKLLVVSDGTHRTIVYEQILRRAQSELIRQKLLAGPATGTFTSATKLALAQFQTRRQLTPTGVPDPATLWLLLQP